jgi:hypothetical protein
MNENRVITITVSMKILISNNYHLWIKKIQSTVEAFDVWKYVDSDQNTSMFQKKFMSSTTDYNVSVIVILKNASFTVIIRSIINIREWIDAQRKEIKTNIIMWDRLIKKITEIKTKL